MGFCEEVVILGEKRAAEFGRSIEHLWIGQTAAAILLNGEDINAAEPQSFRDCPVDVLVHIESYAQDWRSRPRSFSFKGEGPVFCRTSSTKRERRSMSRSNSSLWSQ